MNNFNIVNEKNEFVPFIDLDKEAGWNKEYLANPFRESREIDEETLLNASWFALSNSDISMYLGISS